jgi:Tol biopolymer transport system component
MFATKTRKREGTSILAACLVALLGAKAADAQDVVFSRRVYAPKGQTFEQLWSLTLADESLRPLTNTARSHRNPSCSTDGGWLFFTTADGSRWTLDRATGREQPASQKALDSSADAVTAPPQCDDRTVSISPDGTQIACASTSWTRGTNEVLILDRATKQEIARIPFTEFNTSGDEYPAWPLRSLWSPDGLALLIGIFGEGSSSTVPKMDYFLLEPRTRQWTRAFTGNDPTWGPDARKIVFITPRDLVELPGSSTRKVWSADLAIYDVTTERQTIVTRGGATNNEQPVLCR